MQNNAFSVEQMPVLYLDMRGNAVAAFRDLVTIDPHGNMQHSACRITMSGKPPSESLVCAYLEKVGRQLDLEVAKFMD